MEKGKAASGTHKKQEQIEVSGLEISLDATPLNEFADMGSLVRSHAQRLTTLKKANDLKV